MSVLTILFAAAPAAVPAAEQACTTATPSLGSLLVQFFSPHMYLVHTWINSHGVDFLNHVILAILIYLMGRVVIFFALMAVNKGVSNSKYIHTLLKTLILSTCRKLLYGVLWIIVLSQLGISIAPFIAGLGVTGIIVGFACQDSLSNIASGLMIAINQPFNVGDFVNIGGVSGKIRELNMMATTMNTADNKLVIVPNKSVWGSVITNYSALPTRRVDFVFNVAYGTDISKAIALLRDLVATKEYVLKGEEITTEVVALSASSIDITVRFWVNNADYWTATFDMNKAGMEILEREGIEIPFQQLVVHQA